MNFFNKKLNQASPNQKDNFINPKVLEVNLIKDEIDVNFNWNQHLLSLFMAFFVATLLVTEIYFGLDWWQKQEEQKNVALNLEYETVNRQVNNIKTKANDAIIFKDKLLVTKKMADVHIYWTDFFNWLEKNTLNSVTYNGFSGNILGDYTLSANAKTFSDISWQVKVLKDNKFVDSVRVDSGSSGRGDDKEQIKLDKVVNFSLNLKVKPEIFFRQPE